MINKDLFIEQMIIYLFKDKTYNNTQSLKTEIKKLLNCENNDIKINECFVKIVNYQINKYGCSLYKRR